MKESCNTHVTLVERVHSGGTGEFETQSYQNIAVSKRKRSKERNKPLTSISDSLSSRAEWEPLSYTMQMLKYFFSKAIYGACSLKSTFCFRREQLRQLERQKRQLPTKIIKLVHTDYYVFLGSYKKSGIRGNNAYGISMYVWHALQ